MVASRVPNDGATSGSKAGVVKLSTNRVLYSARSILCTGDTGDTGRVSLSRIEQREFWEGQQSVRPGPGGSGSSLE